MTTEPTTTFQEKNLCQSAQSVANHFPQTNHGPRTTSHDPATPSSPPPLVPQCLSASVPSTPSPLLSPDLDHLFSLLTANHANLDELCWELKCTKQDLHEFFNS